MERIRHGSCSCSIGLAGDEHDARSYHRESLSLPAQGVSKFTSLMDRTYYYIELVLARQRNKHLRMIMYGGLSPCIYEQDGKDILARGVKSTP